jgi:tetratricopeptide (TPR) repeat protein
MEHSSIRRILSLGATLIISCLPGLAVDHLDALLKQADADIDAGDLHGASINLDAIIAQTEKVQPPDPRLPAALMYKAWVAISYQHLDEAEKLLQQALSDLVLLPKTHKTVDNEARCQATFASLKEAQGKYSDSETAYLKSIELLQSIGDIDNQAPSYNGLGALYFKMQRFPECEKAHRKAMELFEVADGKNSDDYICAINNVATALEREKKYDEAARLSSQALNLAETKYGAKSERLLPILDNLATVYQRKKQYDLAEETAKKALDLAQEVAGKDTPALWEYVSSLGLMYLDNGKYKLAEEQLLRAISLLGKAKGDNGDALSLIYYRLGNCYEATKQNSEAESYYKKAIVSTTVPRAKKAYGEDLANLLKKTHVGQ